MFLVGLSGGIGSGKSTVVQVFRELGCAVIDADVLARQVVEPGRPAYERIVRAFGPEILLDDGRLDRRALGDIVFSQPSKRARLNRITHPEIRKLMIKEILKFLVLGYRYVILDIPLLFETQTLLRFMKHTIVVYCDPQAQLRRVTLRDRLSPGQAEARITAQLPLDEKRRLARHVVDNSGDREATRRQVLRLHAQLEGSLDFLPLRLVLLGLLGGLGYLLARQLLS
ncbi:dephospho-CoA kinase domain-containing protein [Tachyglossus aculeatus]|uniref:dephospho-CoA kinase domain-containing protein n=1 Tax=Tachyglossus aculeatus TaxID=9261 RepID=UPI0018F52B23|nr:dephospho-CoA kinase domain-containing protein [Tachyglossus aculeatus]